MSDAPNAAGSAGPSAKKKSAPSKTTHPTYAVMIQEGLTSMKGKGASRQALLKYIMKNYSVGQDEKPVNTHLKLALKAGLEKGTLLQSSGKGATGSVKLSKKPLATAGTTKAATVKKPKASAAAKKPKAPAAKASKKTMKPKKVSLGGTAKAKKPSLTKKSTAKVVTKSKVAPKKAAAIKPKATKAKVAAKPKVTKAVKGKKPAGKK